MTFTSADPIPSGVPFAVTSVGPAGAAVRELADFVGDVVFAIAAFGQTREIRGAGSLDDTGALVHEKDQAGKDVRCWEISRDADGGFAARLEGRY